MFSAEPGTGLNGGFQPCRSSAYTLESHSPPQRTTTDISGHYRMGDSSARQLTNHRLDSWKEIAAFFGRDERTVRRWEKERGLPAHRVPGGGRGGVFAYTDELREWLKGRAEELDSDSGGIRAVPENHGIAVMPTPGLSKSRQR